MRLDLADLELQEATLSVRDGKGRKDRVVPLTARAVKALDVYLREGRLRGSPGARASRRSSCPSATVASVAPGSRSL